MCGVDVKYCVSVTWKWVVELPFWTLEGLRVTQRQSGRHRAWGQKAGGDGGGAQAWSEVRE